MGGQPGGWDEDCLYLNVFAPADAGGGLLPVMVWVHGGAFVGGSGTARWYDGSRFAAGGGVVVVTFNYRLGVLGFLSPRGPGDAAVAGNCGILDQLAALRWVRDNIESFGGDPSRVTVFGESAGAMSIGLMLAMPDARGLFRAAILQSGAASAYQSRDEAQQIADQVLHHFGGSLEELARAPVDRVLDAQSALTAGSDAASWLALRPVADGVAIPEHPDHLIASGHGLDVPVLVGTNRHEMTLFLTMDPAMASLSEEQLNLRAAAMIGARRWAALGGHYRAARTTPTSPAIPASPATPPSPAIPASPASPAVGDGVALLSAATTDLVFRIPALRLAEGQSIGSRVWMYRLDWQSPAAGGRLGATHALDIPFVWNLLDLPGVDLFTGDGPGRQRLATAMHDAWLAFATTGDPSTPLLPSWPRYQPPRRATMIFDAECSVVDDPNGAERELWGRPESE